MGLILNVKGTTAQGPFGFIANVGDLTVDILKQGLATGVPATQNDIVGQTVTVVSQSGMDGAAGPAGAPGESGGIGSLTPNLDGLFSSDAPSEVLYKEVLEDFGSLPSGSLVATFSAFARALGGATGTFRLRIGGTDGGVDGTLVATITTTSTSYQMLAGSGNITSPGGRALVKLTGQSSVSGLTVQVKSTLARFVPT